TKMPSPWQRERRSERTIEGDAPPAGGSRRGEHRYGGLAACLDTRRDLPQKAGCGSNGHIQQMGLMARESTSHRTCGRPRRPPDATLIGRRCWLRYADAIERAERLFEQRAYLAGEAVDGAQRRSEIGGAGLKLQQ